MLIPFVLVAALTAAVPEPQQPTVPEIQFVTVPAGAFIQGSNSGLVNERPAHRVRISKPFEMGKFEVTQAQWQAVMGQNPSHFTGATLPVEQISWTDAQQFIQKLNALQTGYTYRLPTEAEWEYAARAGTTGNFGGSGKPDEMAWHSGNAGAATRAVGAKSANAWGLHDMHGNVWEWCEDWYGKHYYRSSPSVDPQGPEAGTSRVCRGGAWNYSASRCTSSSRAHPAPDDQYNFIGLRLVRTKTELAFPDSGP